MKANVAEILRFRETGKRMLWEDDVLPRATDPPFLSAVHAKNDTTNLFDYNLSKSKENEQSFTFHLRYGNNSNF